MTGRGKWMIAAGCMLSAIVVLAIKNPSSQSAASSGPATKREGSSGTAASSGPATPSAVLRGPRSAGGAGAKREGLGVAAIIQPTSTVVASRPSDLVGLGSALTRELRSKKSWTKGTREAFDAYASAVMSHFRGKGVSLTLYDVKKGDNFWVVSKRHGIDIDTVVGANGYLVDLLAQLGQRIMLTNRKGALHRVVPKETVESIVDTYNRRISNPKKRLTVDHVIQANQMRWLVKIKAGDVLFLPGITPQQMTEEIFDAFALTDLFGYPLWRGGKYTSFTGIRVDPITDEKRYHNGVDIKTPSGTKVCAVASGTVEFAGWQGGYGMVVRIRHTLKDPTKPSRTDVYETLYGHNSKVLVSAGKKVKMGQVIAISGSTGRSTGPHLHFTIWKNGKIVDPLKFLWR